jgi:hypothetical protein
LMHSCASEAACDQVSKDENGGCLSRAVHIRLLGGETYERFKDTSETGPIYQCPSCQRRAYIDFEQACAVCGEKFGWEANCWRCHATIPLEDALAGFDEGICPYCRYILDKDD